MKSKTPNEIDSVIIGSPVGMQGCAYACAGAVRNQASDRVYIYGVNAGTGGASVTGGTMKLIGKLPTSEFNKLLSSK